MLIDETPPVAGAAQIAELAAQLRLPVAHAAEPDGAARLGRLVEVAIRLIEARTGRALSPRRFRLQMPAWPANRRIELPVAPATAIEAAAVAGPDGRLTSIDPARLRLDPFGPLPAGVPAGPEPWPAVPRDGHAEITFRAGYGPDWSDVPPDLRTAVVLLAATLHETGQQPEPVPMPFGVLALIEPYRRIRL
jgi:uncharacterized phiE125 gp8 family phage protein